VLGIHIVLSQMHPVGAYILGRLDSVVDEEDGAMGPAQGQGFFRFAEKIGFLEFLVSVLYQAHAAFKGGADHLKPRTARVEIVVGYEIKRGMLGESAGA